MGSAKVPETNQEMILSGAGRHGCFGHVEGGNVTELSKKRHERDTRLPQDISHNQTKTMMRIRKNKWPVLAAASLGVMAFTQVASAQSSDALLDKLVEKGILTTKEATELRQEADQNFNDAYKVKTGMPDWVDQFKLYGDIRGRLESFKFDNDAPGNLQPNDDRTRYRYRLRFGATVTMKENFEAGLRLTSSEAVGTSGGDPISGNTTLGQNASKKFLYVDLAYGKWTPIKSGPWLLSGTIGKMENPFVVSDMIFDGDYTPEGAALQSAYTFNDVHSLKFNGGAFILNEIGQSAAGQASDDPWFLGGQLRHDAKWSPKLASALSASWMSLFSEQNLGNAAVPNVNVGNTRYTAPVLSHLAGDLQYDYTPIILGGSLTYSLDSFPVYKGAFPIMVTGEWMNNFGAPDNNQGWWAGVTFGKSGKRGTWEVSYRYKYLESDAWYEEFTDSDFGAYYQLGGIPAAAGKPAAGYQAGTGTKGHIIKGVYSFTDAFSVSATFFLTELIDTPTVAVDGVPYTESGTRRMQLDATWKF
jgi:hypothetical protein